MAAKATFRWITAANRAIPPMRSSRRPARSACAAPRSTSMSVAMAPPPSCHLPAEPAAHHHRARGVAGFLDCGKNADLKVWRSRSRGWFGVVCLWPLALLPAALSSSPHRRSTRFVCCLKLALMPTTRSVGPLGFQPVVRRGECMDLHEEDQRRQERLARSLRSVGSDLALLSPLCADEF